MFERIIDSDVDLKLKEKQLCYMLTKHEKDSMLILSVLDERDCVFHLALSRRSSCFVPERFFRIFNYGGVYWMMVIRGQETSV